MEIEFFPPLFLIMAVFYGIGFLHGRFPEFNRDGRDEDRE